MPQCIRQLLIMPFLYHIPINDIHVATRAVVGLLRDHVAKGVFEFSLDLNILCRIRNGFCCFFGGFRLVHFLCMNVKSPVRNS